MTSQNRRGRVGWAGQVKAAAAREEMKAAHRDLLKLRNEDNTLRALFSLTRTKLEQQTASFEQQAAELEARLAAAQAEAAAEAKSAQLRIAGLEAQLQAAREQLEAVGRRAAAAAEIATEQLADQRREAAAQMRASEAQLGAAAALLVLDPGRCGPLSLRTAVGPVCSYVTGLGLQEHVPRFLR